MNRSRPVQPDPVDIVAAGYDRIAARYAEWSAGIDDAARERHTRWLLDALPAGSHVLDLGCGDGHATTRRLAERFHVTGVDCSAAQVAHARVNVPAATILQAEMTTLDLAPGSVDAVVAFYSLTHVPRRRHRTLLASIASWLRPGGVLLATMGAAAAPDAVEADWLGAPMFFSHYDAATNRRLVHQAGFELVSADVATIVEEGVPVPFLWIVAWKPGNDVHLPLGEPIAGGGDTSTKCVDAWVDGAKR